jgi:tetratricopeptide (TPR) repeat protein
VLEGKVRRSGNRIRVGAQLIDTATGVHLWAERYDRDIADVFAMQDDITHAVALAIEPTIANIEQQRAMRRPPGSLGAWEAYQRGLWHQSRFAVQENIEARKLFQHAIVLDPTFAPAYQGLAHTFIDENRLFFTRSLDATIAAAAPLAHKAVALDVKDAGAHTAVGWVSLTQGDLGEAIEEARQALALNPNCADAYRLVGTALVFSGEPEEGCEVLLRYLRLSPHDPRNWSAFHMMTMARYLLGDYPGAVDAAKRTLRANPGQPVSYRWLVAALGQLGRIVEAAQVMRSAPAAVAPLSFDEYVQRRWPWQRQDAHDHMLQGLARAGWRAASGSGGAMDATS